jgi:hypothetical protein
MSTLAQPHRNKPRRNKPLFPNQIAYPTLGDFSKQAPGDMRHPDDKVPDKTPKRKFLPGELLREAYHLADLLGNLD